MLSTFLSKNVLTLFIAMLMKNEINHNIFQVAFHQVRKQQLEDNSHREKNFGVKGSSNSIFYFTRLLFSLLMCMRLKKSRYPPMISKIVVAKVVLDKPPWIKMPNVNFSIHKLTRHLAYLKDCPSKRVLYIENTSCSIPWNFD